MNSFQNWIIFMILLMWNMVFFITGYPAISQFFNMRFRSNTIKTTLVLRTGKVRNSWAPVKKQVWKYNKTDYVVTEKYLLNRQGLWHEGIAQQLPWPEESWDVLETKGLRAEDATNVYHSRVAEWLNLVRSNPQLMRIIILVTASLCLNLVLLYLAYLDHVTIVQMKNFMLQKAGGITV